MTLLLRWRGPDDRVAALAAADTPTAIPTVIGPPGPPGQMPDTIDCGTFQ
jgi:hypothetical protein